MNEIQRSVIQRHFKQLADDIMMTEDLYGALFQSKIFERNMIDIIKAEKTPQDQVYKMLSMLTKRGPEAFDLFIEIIKDDYPWLSTSLETSYKTFESISRQNSMVTICTCGSVKMDNNTENQPQTKPANEIPADSDIKTRVGQFIHKQFGQSKRISQTDKKSMERWFSEQLQQERKRKQKELISVSTDDCLAEHTAESQPVQPDPVLEKLNQVFNKVKNENQSEPRDSSQDGDIHSELNEQSDNFDEVDGTVNEKVNTEDVTNLLDTEIDKLINRQTELERQITQCQYILGDHDNKCSLPELVKNAVYDSKQFERELVKEKEKSEKMLGELYDYCKSINKLETVRKTLRHQLDKQEAELNTIKSENNVLREKCRIMEAEKMQHLEKEQTIENLRKVIQEFKQAKADENANYKSTYGYTRTSRRPTRTQARRGSFDQGIQNGNSPFRKSIVKQTTQNTSRRKQLTKY